MDDAGYLCAWAVRGLVRSEGKDTQVYGWTGGKAGIRRGLVEWQMS